MKLRSLLLVAILSVAPLHAFNPLTGIDGLMFGLQNASDQYQALVRQAAKDYGYPTTNITVKKMNSLTVQLMGNLYSFTLFGIWINEELLNAAPAAVRTWIIYHEVAHYLKNHHAHVLGLGATLAPLVYLFYKRTYYTSNRVIALITSTALSYGLTQYGIKPLVKEQEKEADLAVLRIMIAKKEYSIIAEYLDFLKEQIQDGYGDSSDGWHYTFNEQYEYLLHTLYAYNH